MEDEQVRRALDRGCDREAVMEVLGVSERSTFYKTKRAFAFDFPLDAFSRGGRPSGEQPQPSDSDPSSESTGAQQRLDTGTDAKNDDRGRTETWGGDAIAESRNADAATLLSAFAQNGATGDSSDDLRQEVNDAIEALEALRSELE